MRFTRHKVTHFHIRTVWPPDIRAFTRAANVVYHGFLGTWTRWHSWID